MTDIRKLILLALAGLGLAAAAPAPAPTVAPIRLYALDCGHMESTDLDFFADTDELRGRRGRMAIPCFLIRHPKGDLLWNAGLPDALSALPGGTGEGGPPGSRMAMPVTLRDQLRRIGLDYGDIRWFAFSHAHPDHVGNGPALVNATWLINRREQAWLRRSPTPLGADIGLLPAIDAAKARIDIDIDHDVFGDGTVRILQAPGHTPGHQVLLVKLPHAGAVLLAGDLYHFRQSRAHHLVPRFNDSRADTLASMDKIERVARAARARVVIEHDPQDFAAMPKFPAYLD